MRFSVSEVEVSSQRRKVLDAGEAIASLVNKPVEAWGVAPGRLVRCDIENVFANAACDAFYGHHPLRIRPDDVWMCIAQGFATHVNQNVEALRHRFVAHSGKLTLSVSRPDFVLGQPNPWPEAFAAFSDQVASHVGKLRDLVAQRFSTSGAMEQAAFDVAVMDTFQGFFEYEFRGGCGIPEIELLGTPADWASIVTRTRHLSEYGLEGWTDALVPVLERIQATAEGAVDREFWRSFFRYQGGSGPAELTGWILTLFPYLTEGKEGLVFNRYLADWSARWQRAAAGGLSESKRAAEGPGLWVIPGGQVSAPVRYVQFPAGAVHNLRFVAGHVGVHQDESDGTLSPAFGWAVIHDDVEPLRRARSPLQVLEAQVAEFLKEQKGG
ncbi:MAG: DUF4419 domain-containing protein [Myxococcales bacterium]|nr:DUF4419 domain-containing protein [Myxococcales bacterium]MCB9651466.1 DUF4419 domain-containing protein [Deltaproteobacteria bacterium]